jgi:signal transduction histidine kinase
VRITAGTLLHEVRNPLMSILGEAELILDHTEPHDTEVAGKVRAIRRSARRIQSILERLAAISDPCIKETASGHMIDSGMASPGRFQTVDDTSLAE